MNVLESSTRRPIKHTQVVGDSYLGTWLGRSSCSGPNTSNQSSVEMPFQRWFRFKEAFAPSFVVDSVARLPYQPKSCLDPFGGSGTTALTCQFMGIKPTTVEVNPFMADLIESKLAEYDCAALGRSIHDIECDIRTLRGRISGPYLKGTPPTFVAPGVKGRWLYDNDNAKVIESIKIAIERLEDPKIQRLFRICLGSCLIEASNVVVNGKGRRYRKGWSSRSVDPDRTLAIFLEACSRAFVDIKAFRHRSHDYTMLRGDSRLLAGESEKVDFILTSPPYPNSFDYTDIYNVELWVLGYLNSADESRYLRKQTLRSHVQVAHEGVVESGLTPSLKRVYRQLVKSRSEMWNKNIPEMICRYFADMRDVLVHSKAKLNTGGHMMLAVGDSRYQGVHVDVPKILTEIAEDLGFQQESSESVRSMRTSAQQGGQRELHESLLWLKS